MDLVLGSVLGVSGRILDLLALQTYLPFTLRALPVMYAVALDLRIFANNVSSISYACYFKFKSAGWLLLNFHVLLPEGLRDE